MAQNHINGSSNGDFEEDDEIADSGRCSMLDSLAGRDEQGRAVVLDRMERSLKRLREKSEAERDQDAPRMLREHLWTALALRWNAPFSDVRLRMVKLLEDAKVSDMEYSPLLVGPKTLRAICRHVEFGLAVGVN